MTISLPMILLVVGVILVVVGVVDVLRRPANRTAGVIIVIVGVVVIIFSGASGV